MLYDCIKLSIYICLVLEDDYNPNEGTSKVPSDMKKHTILPYVSSTCTEESEGSSTEVRTKVLKTKKRKYIKSKIGDKYIVAPKSQQDVVETQSDDNDQG